MDLTEINAAKRRRAPRSLALGAAFLVAFMVFPSVASADQTIPESPVARVAGGLNPLNWKMPQFKIPNFRALLPGQQDQRRIVKKKDNLVDDVSKTASNSWQKTKDALNPSRFAPSNMFGVAPASATSPPDSPGFFSSLFQQPAEPEPVTTVTDFLSQSKPNP